MTNWLSFVVPDEYLEIDGEYQHKTGSVEGINVLSTIIIFVLIQKMGCLFGAHLILQIDTSSIPF